MVVGRIRPPPVFRPFANEDAAVGDEVREEFSTFHTWIDTSS